MIKTDIWGDNLCNNRGYRDAILDSLQSFQDKANSLASVLLGFSWL